MYRGGVARRRAGPARVTTGPWFGADWGVRGGILAPRSAKSAPNEARRGVVGAPGRSSCGSVSDASPDAFSCPGVRTFWFGADSGVRGGIPAPRMAKSAPNRRARAGRARDALRWPGPRRSAPAGPETLCAGRAETPPACRARDALRRPGRDAPRLPGPRRPVPTEPRAPHAGHAQDDTRQRSPRRRPKGRRDLARVWPPRKTIRQGNGNAASRPPGDGGAAREACGAY